MRRPRGRRRGSVRALIVGLLTSLASGAAASTASAAGLLPAGGSLAAGQSIVSPGGEYVLTMQDDGNLVLHGASGARWSTRTFGRGRRGG